jgi:hypothetical protein
MSLIIWYCMISSISLYYNKDEKELYLFDNSMDNKD